jgi:hypothetical protein
MEDFLREEETMKRMHPAHVVRSAALLAEACTMAVALPAWGASVLSLAQQNVIAKTTAKMSKAEKEILAEMSDAGKLAEFFGSPAALAKFRKEVKGADRVSLGPDDEGVKKFVLDGNRKLSGRGTVRTPGNWKRYTFECVLDPGKATVNSFTYKFEGK